MIAYDNSDKASSTSATNLTLSNFTVGSGANRLLLVTTLGGANQNATGVTYNSVAMTHVTTSDGGGEDLWYLFAPASGSHDIVASWGVGPQSRIILAASYSGVLQSGFPDALNNTLNVTPVAVGSWAFSWARKYTGSINFTNYTQRQAVTGAAFTQYAIADTNGIVSGSTTFTTDNTADTKTTLSIAPAPDVSSGMLLLF